MIRPWLFFLFFLFYSAKKCLLKGLQFVMKRSQCCNWKHTEMLVMMAGRAGWGYWYSPTAEKLVATPPPTPPKKETDKNFGRMLWRVFVVIWWWCWWTSISLVFLFFFGKVMASGSGTLTTIAWMAPPLPPPGRNGQRISMTRATPGSVHHSQTH